MFSFAMLYFFKKAASWTFLFPVSCKLKHNKVSNSNLKAQNVTWSSDLIEFEFSLSNRRYENDFYIAVLYCVLYV